jgi:hypothetical protein
MAAATAHGPLELSFLDPAGLELARATRDPSSGTFYLSAPSSYDCREVEQRAAFTADARKEWDRCFDRQSRWIAAWINKLSYVDVQSGSCTIRLRPSVTRSRDAWWLWWVPLPHLAGNPYTSFHVDVQFHSSHCG